VTPRLARALLALQLVLLLVGTQMPGAWRSSIESGLHAPFGLSSWAHFIIFAGMATVLSAKPMRWPVLHTLVTTLALAIVTEALQFLAIDRHPRLLDIGIDMAGACVGVVLVGVWRRMG
jgi:VanZ family protein